MECGAVAVESKQELERPRDPRAHDQVRCLLFSFFCVFVLFEEASLRYAAAQHSAATSPSSSSSLSSSSSFSSSSPPFSSSAKKATAVPSTSFAELQLSYSALYFFSFFCVCFV